MAKFLRELKRGGYTTKNGDVVSTVRFQLEEEDVGPANGYPEGAVSHEPNNNAAMEEMMNKMQEIQEKYDRLKANQEAAKTARETKEESDFELQDPFGSAMVMGFLRANSYGQHKQYSQNHMHSFQRR